MITILSDRRELDESVPKLLKSRKIPFAYYNVEDYQIEECAGCNGCVYITPGACVQRDDTGRLYPAILNSDTVLILTGISYGSYSFAVKRVLDKFGLAGSRFYRVDHGKLKKGGGWSKAPDLKHYYVIGYQMIPDTGQREIFLRLVNEMYQLTQLTGCGYTAGSDSEILKKVEELL